MQTGYKPVLPCILDQLCAVPATPAMPAAVHKQPQAQMSPPSYQPQPSGKEALSGMSDTGSSQALAFTMFATMSFASHAHQTALGISPSYANACPMQVLARRKAIQGHWGDIPSPEAAAGSRGPAHGRQRQVSAHERAHGVAGASPGTRMPSLSSCASTPCMHAHLLPAHASPAELQAPIQINPASMLTHCTPPGPVTPHAAHVLLGRAVVPLQHSPQGSGAGPGPRTAVQRSPRQWLPDPQEELDGHPGQGGWVWVAMVTLYVCLPHCVHAW